MRLICSTVRIMLVINKIRSQLVQNAASILRSPVHLIPSFVQKKAMLDSMLMVFREAIDDGDFAFLSDKWLKIEIHDMNLHWYISYQNDNLIIANKEVIEDVRFSGNLNDLVLIAGRKEDPDTLFFQRRLLIEGDTELGLEVKNLMDSIDLEQFPKPMQVVLQQLAEFVHKGLSEPAAQSNNEVVHAYSN